MKKTTILLILTLLVLTGCTFTVATPPVVAVTEALAGETSGSLSVATATSTSEMTFEVAALEETTEPSRQIFEPFIAHVLVNQVNLRTNPGYLFPSLLQLHEGDEITVLAKAPGNEWLYVELPDGSTGWIFTFLVETDYDLTSIPVQKPVDVQIISGQVRTEAEVPINGVQFAVIQTSASGELRNDAVTDETGTFTAFMPLDVSGEWTVSYAAISCTSIVHDSSCNTLPQYVGTVNPASQNVTLPDPGILEFIWK